MAQSAVPIVTKLLVLQVAQKEEAVVEVEREEYVEEEEAAAEKEEDEETMIAREEVILEGRTDNQQTEQTKNSRCGSSGAC